LRSSALHRAYHLAVHDQCTERCSLGFLDKLLDNDPGLQSMEGLHHRLGGFLGLRQNYTQTLRPFKQFDDQRRAADLLHELLLAAFRKIGEGGLWHAQTVSGQNLQAAKLIPAANDRLGIDRRKRPHQLKLANYGGSVESDRGSDSRNDRVDPFEFLTSVDNRRSLLLDDQIAQAVIYDQRFMTSLDDFLCQPARGV